MGQAAKQQMFDINSDLDGESEVLTLGRSLFHGISIYTIRKEHEGHAKAKHDIWTLSSEQVGCR